MNRAFSRIEIKSATDSSDGRRRTFEGIASTPSADRMEDEVMPSGAKFALPIPFLHQHKSDRPVGQITEARVAKDGIHVKGYVERFDEPPSLKERVDVAWAEIKSGLVRGLSIGFRPLSMEPIKNSNGIRFTSWEWLELSAVTIPANAEANITTIKSIDAASRAALGAQAKGNSRGDTQPPGASGLTSKGKKMRTLKQLQEERGGVAARIKELNEGAGGDISTLTTEEQSEFDELGTKQEELDVAIRRAKSVELATKGAIEVPQSSEQPKGNARTFREPKDEPKLEKGVAFAQMVKFLGRARAQGGGRMEALYMAEAAAKSMPMYVDARVPLALKAAVEAGSVSGTDTAGNWGMGLVSAAGGPAADFAEWLRPQTILGKFGQGGIPALNRVPFRSRLGSVTSGGTGYWVGEGKAKPLTKFGVNFTTLDPLKCAAMAAATMELLEDSDPSADLMIRNALRDALIEAEDRAFIDPANAGSTGVKPASITYGVSGSPSTGTDAASVRADVKGAMAGFIAANNPAGSAVWIMSASDALSLSLMFNAIGGREFDGIDINGGRFAGLPVIVSEYVPSDTGGHVIVLVNTRDVYYADTGGITVRTSDQASLEMDDAPGASSIVPTAATTNMVSMFQTNSVAFLAEQRLNWAKRRDEAVQVITGASWGTGGTGG